jgi:hypothetical protein
MDRITEKYAFVVCPDLVRSVACSVGILSYGASLVAHKRGRIASGRMLAIAGSGLLGFGSVIDVSVPQAPPESAIEAPVLTNIFDIRTGEAIASMEALSS